jgi:hypothetical protein
VPAGKKGILFTSGDQVIHGFGSGTDPKVVKLDDHLSLPKGGSIELGRGATRGTEQGNIGTEDAKIKSTVADGHLLTNAQSSSLDIYGVGKRYVDGTSVKTLPRQIKLYDDVIINGNLKVKNYTGIDGNHTTYGNGAGTARMELKEGVMNLIGPTNINLNSDSNIIHNVPENASHIFKVGNKEVLKITKDGINLVNPKNPLYSYDISWPDTTGTMQIIGKGQADKSAAWSRGVFSNFIQDGGVTMPGLTVNGFTLQHPKNNSRSTVEYNDSRAGLVWRHKGNGSDNMDLTRGSLEWY